MMARRVLVYDHFTAAGATLDQIESIFETIKITSTQGSGKTTMANLIADMCKAHDIASYSMAPLRAPDPTTWTP
jgi:thymidylate kinase